MGSLGEAVVVRRPQTSDIMQSGSTLSLALRGHKLDNKDFFSKSDPYIVISKPVNGGWTPIRTSESIKDDLNPTWRPFLIYEQELPGESEKIKFEVFDDDGKDSRDESIGAGFFTLTELENAYKSQTLLPIHSKRFGKKTGSLLLVQFKINSEAAPGPCSNYPAPAKAPVNEFYHGATSGAGGFVMPGRN